MARNTIPGFDYRTGKAVEWTAGQWRQLFPADHYTRRVENGETFYTRVKHYIETPRGKEWVEARIAAEAYATIPAGKTPKV